MQSKIYMLTFDPAKTNASAVHNTIANSIYVQDWWHYLAPTYLIKSNYTLATIHQQLMASIPGNSFMLMEVNPYNSNGWLPQAAWDWINTRR